MKSFVLCLLALLSVFANSQASSKQVSDAQLKTLKAEYTATKALYTKKPTDAKLKKKYVDSSLAYGLGCMYSVSLPPREKYKSALVYFREVLKLDPKNKVAKEQKVMIESIYKQMGRPIPGGQ
jgi:hypothetical protein